METKRTGNISSCQKKELVEFMAQHPELGSGKFSKKFTFKVSQELWMEVTTILNSLPGANKTWQQWRKTWNDLKTSVKRKNSNVKKYQAGTGGGPALPNCSQITDDDEKLIGLMRPVAIEGHASEEPLVTFNFEEADQWDGAEFTINDDHGYFIQPDDNENPETEEEKLVVSKETPIKSYDKPKKKQERNCAKLHVLMKLYQRQRRWQSKMKDELTTKGSMN